MISARRVYMYVSLLHFSFSASAQLDVCKSVPPYFSKLGFDSQLSFLSTSENNIVGLVLLQSDQPGHPNATVSKRFQDDSWKSKGNLGAISTDHKGNSYVLPTAKVNILLNPPHQQNTIYKVDGITGRMTDFISLPMDITPGSKNPFGLLGSFYDCSKGQLFVSSVAGSDEDNQRGIIYCINTTTRKVNIILRQFDAYGLAVHYQEGRRILYISSARESKLFSMELDEHNNPVTKLKQEFSFLGVGPRGDDKIRKIRFTRDGKMQLFTILFYFNLTAPSERQQSKLTYIFDKQTQLWKLEGVE